MLFEGRDLLGAPDEDLRKIRGEEIAMIFQDPLSSLHPFYRVGDQLVEAVRAHHDVSKAAGARARGGDAVAGRHPRRPQPARARIRTSSPAACASAR